MSVVTGRFWDQFNPAIAQSLSADQRVEIERVLGLDPAHRPSTIGDLRVSFYWFFVRVLWGREKRSLDRIKQDGIEHPAITRRNLPALLALGAGYVAFWHVVLGGLVALAIAYLLR